MKALTELRRAEKNAILWFAEIMRRKLYREIGYSSVHTYAREALGFSKVKTSQFIRLAESLEELPALLTGKEVELVKGAHLKDRNLRFANAEGAFLVKADLRGADLSGACLYGADLREANFIRACLSSDFQGADLRNAEFKNADLSRARLDGADLRGAKSLTINQLSRVITLYKAKLDPELMDQIKKDFPHLLKEYKRKASGSQGPFDLLP